MKKIYWFVCIIALLLPATAFAVGMTPVNTFLNLEPNNKAKQVIELRNPDDSLHKIKVSASGFEINTDGSLSYSSGPFTAEKWITVNPTELVVRPYDFGVVRFEVKVPADPAPTPGSYGAAIMMSDEPVLPEQQQAQKQEGTTATFRIGSQLAHIVFISVGEPNYNVKLESFEVKREKDKAYFAYHLKNLGNFNYPSKGVIRIESGGKKVEELNVSPATIYRNTSKTVTVDVPSKLAPGSYEAFLSLDLNKGQKLEARTSFTITSQ